MKNYSMSQHQLIEINLIVLPLPGSFNCNKKRLVKAFPQSKLVCIETIGLNPCIFNFVSFYSLFLVMNVAMLNS